MSNLCLLFFLYCFIVHLFLASERTKKIVKYFILYKDIHDLGSVPKICHSIEHTITLLERRKH